MKRRAEDLSIQKYPDVDQVIHVDLESTDKITANMVELPWIIQLSARTIDDQLFSTMITPKSKDFIITYGSTEIHGWTKEKLINLQKKHRPTLDQAWKDFMDWVS